MGVAADKVRWGIAPCFLVDDVVATANFYRDQLGFRYERFWGDPPCFAMVRREGATIMLSQSSEPGLGRPNCAADPQRGGWDAYVWIDDADALYEEFRQKDVTIAEPIGNQEYGCREFTIRDCNGYSIGFGQNLEG